MSNSVEIRAKKSDSLPVLNPKLCVPLSKGSGCYWFPAYPLRVVICTYKHICIIYPL